MKRRAALVALAAAVVLSLAGCPSVSPSPAGGVEQGDCDAEDRRNREAECGYSDSDRRKLTTPKPGQNQRPNDFKPAKPAVKPPAKPATKR